MAAARGTATARALVSSSRSASTVAAPASSSSASSSSSAASASSSSASILPPRNVLHHAQKPKPLVLGPTQLNRYEEHYRQTLAPSLLYMTYDPEWSRLNASEKIAVARTSHSKRQWDPSSPYSQNRPERPAKGNRKLLPGPTKPDFANPAKDLVALDRIVITAFHKEAITNRNVLLPLVAQFRAITGLSQKGSFQDPAMGLDDPSATLPLGGIKGRGHVSVLRAKSGAASFKLRPGMPVGVQAFLPRPLAMQFLEVLITFVLPRLRTFPGFLLPPASQLPGSPAAQSGVVSLGMGPEAMALFPQLEINWDAYPGKPVGFQIDCITNQRGPKATERARQLLSGWGVPFVRRGDVR